MTSWEDRLRADSRARYARSADAGVLLGAVTLAPHWQAVAAGEHSFSTWRGGFEREYDSILDDARARLVDKHAALADLIPAASDRALPNDWHENPLVKSLRDASVNERWKLESFFAHQGEAARGVLTYVDVADGQPVSKLYDDEQWHALLAGDRPQVSGETLHGHHVNSVANALQEHGTGVVPQIMDPENVRVTTPTAHRVVEHAGNFQNPSHGPAHEVTDRHDGIVDAKHDEARAHAEAQTGDHLALGALCTGLAAGSFGALLRLRQLRHDPRPWKRKAGLAAVTLVSNGAIGGSISLASGATGHIVRSALAEHADALADALPDSVGDSLLTEVLGDAAIFGVATVLRLGVTGVRDLRAGRSFGHVSRRAGRALAIAGGEQLAFLALELLAGAYVPIPDPVLGPLLTDLRLTYTLGKLGWGLRERQQSAAAMHWVRFEFFHDQARTACA